MDGSTCPYCRSAFEPADEIVTCPGCATKHHADCLQENGGCTVFGCSHAPPEEPRINVSYQDVTAGSQPEPISSHPPPPMPLFSIGNTRPPPMPPGTVPPPPRPDTVAIQMGTVQEAPHLTFAGYAPRPLQAPGHYAARKSRVVFVLLAVLLGAFGGHNFYAGYVKKAVIQLCITLLSCFAGSFISWIWAIVEACIVDCDDDGMAFV